MTPPADPERYKNHRFPGEIISHGVWLYYRFPLSYRDVQELLCERGIDVTHEAIRQWCLRFGQDYANQLKRRRAQPGDTWHLDEVFLTINGKRHYLWRFPLMVNKAPCGRTFNLHPLLRGRPVARLRHTCPV
jgi:transposase-like protein